MHHLGGHVTAVAKGVARLRQRPSLPEEACGAHAQLLPVWPGMPHTPGRHTCSFSEARRAEGQMLPGQGQLPAAAPRIGLRMASPSGSYVAAHAMGACHACSEGSEATGSTGRSRHGAAGPCRIWPFTHTTTG